MLKNPPATPQSKEGYNKLRLIVDQYKDPPHEQKGYEEYIWSAYIHNFLSPEQSDLNACYLHEQG